MFPIFDEVILHNLSLIPHEQFWHSTFCHICEMVLHHKSYMLSELCCCSSILQQSQKEVICSVIKMKNKSKFCNCALFFPCSLLYPLLFSFVQSSFVHLSLRRTIQYLNLFARGMSSSSSIDIASYSLFLSFSIFLVALHQTYLIVILKLLFLSQIH